MKTPEFSSELFTVALTFDRHHCPWAKILPVSKPYKLGVFGLWCSVQTLFKIKAKLQEKLADVGLISVVSNPMGRSVSVSVQVSPFPPVATIPQLCGEQLCRWGTSLLPKLLGALVEVSRV